MRNIVKLRDILSFGAFAAIIVAVLGYFGTLGLRVQPPDDRTNLTMEVSDINGVVTGSNVLLRGVSIGKVFRTSTSVSAATIEFYVDGGYRIPVDSEVRLENLSALGESYIALIPRTDGGPVLEDGQRISTRDISQPPSISELATSVVRVLGQLDPAALQRIINELDAALPDPAKVLPNIARASTLLRNTVSEFQGSGRAVLDNFQSILARAEYVAPVFNSLGPTLGELGKYSQDVAKGAYATIIRNDIDGFNKLVKRVSDLLDDRGPELRVLGEAFQPKLNAIAAALMNFDTGQILDRMLAAVPADGAITLRVVP